MKCPKCRGQMVYEEHVDGVYVYPVRDADIDWTAGVFEGECYEHAFRCLRCGFRQPADISGRVQDMSGGEASALS